MSDRVRWINHKGQKILYGDCSNLPEDEFVNEIQRVNKAVIESGDKVVFVLANMVGVRVTEVTRQAGQSVRDSATAQGITIYTSMVGISKLQRIIVNAVVRDVYFAKDEEDAKEWLVKQAEKVKNEQPVG